jgi:hypothetical protein
MGVSQTFCPGWPWTTTLPISIFWGAGITCRICCLAQNDLFWIDSCSRIRLRYMCNCNSVLKFFFPLKIAKPWWWHCMFWSALASLWYHVTPGYHQWTIYSQINIIVSEEDGGFSLPTYGSKPLPPSLPSFLPPSFPPSFTLPPSLHSISFLCSSFPPSLSLFPVLLLVKLWVIFFFFFKI